MVSEGRTDGSVAADAAAATEAEEVAAVVAAALLLFKVALPGDESSDDSESKDWSPPKPESSSKTRECEGGGGGRDTLDDPRPFFPPTPDEAVAEGKCQVRREGDEGSGWVWWERVRLISQFKSREVANIFYKTQVQEH